MMRRNFLAALIAGAAAILGGKAQKGRATTGQADGDTQDSSSTKLAEMRQKLRAALPYECVTVAGGDALSEWKRLHDLGQGWPVIIGDDEALDRIAEQYSLDDPAMLPAIGTPLCVIAQNSGRNHCCGGRRQCPGRAQAVLAR